MGIDYHVLDVTIKLNGRINWRFFVAHTFVRRRFDDTVGFLLVSSWHLIPQVYSYLIILQPERDRSDRVILVLL